jgi:hypothetical protein
LAQATLQVFTQVGTDSVRIDLTAAGCRGTASLPGSADVQKVNSDLPVLWPNGGKFTLTASEDWVNTPLSATLFPADPPGNTSAPTKIEVADLSRTGNQLTVKMSAPKFEGNAPANGDKFNGSIQSAVGQQTFTIAEFGPIYVYQNDAASQVAMSSVAPASLNKAQVDAGEQIKLSLKYPEKFQAAYQSFVGRKLYVAFINSKGDVIDYQEFKPPLDKEKREQKSIISLNAKAMGDTLGTAASVDLTLQLVSGRGDEAISLPTNPASLKLTITKTPTP